MFKHQQLEQQQHVTSRLLTRVSEANGDDSSSPDTTTTTTASGQQRPPRPPTATKPTSRRRYSRDNEQLARHVAAERHQAQAARRAASSRPPTDPIQAWTAAPGTPQKLEEAMEFKERLNVSRNQVIQDKLKAFKQQYPTKRY